MNRALPLAIVALVLTFVAESHAQTIESPRLQALERALAQRSPDAVASFWREVATMGTPLIERADEHDGFALVTFVWRGDDDTKHVFVDGQLGQLAGTRRNDNRLAQLRNTSVWYRSYWLRNDLQSFYRFGVNAALIEPETASPTEPGFYQDPHGKPWRLPDSPDWQGKVSVIRSVLQMPKARQSLWLNERAGVAGGQLQQSTWKSPLLKNEREIWVYTPPGYSTSGDPLHLLITTDGGPYVGPLKAPTTLNNLIADKRIPPVVAVFVGNAPNRPGAPPPRGTELSCNETFVKFLADEIVPWVRTNYRAATTPSQTTIAGFSLGGLTAAFAALRRPDVFGNVLSQSGSYWWKPAGEPEGEWLSKQFVSAPKLNLKFYMDAGLSEVGNPSEVPVNWRGQNRVPFGPSLLFTNRHMRDVLRAKGYEVHYAEFSGGHNALGWSQTFADGLIALIGIPQQRTAR